MTPEEYNQREMNEGRLSWEHITELVMFWQQEHGLHVDGKAGRLTQISLLPPRPDTPIKDWKPWDGPLGDLPKSRAQIVSRFGNPGVGSADPDWERQSIVTVRDLPGVPRKWYFKTHRLAEPYMREGLRRAHLSDPEYSIERAASYVFRHIRHDKNRPLSMHAYGIAIDVDPQYNRGKTFKHGKAPKAWSDEWKKLWPNGLSEPFVRAMQSVGFAWGGDWDEDGDSTDHWFIDPMHFELVDRAR